MKISEDQIPELIRNGKDKEVIPHLYKKVFPLVENYIRKNSGRKEDASDVFQDCLLLFYKQVIKNTFDPKYKVYGYLYRISINLWINKIKKEQKKAQPRIATCEWACNTLSYGIEKICINGVILINKPERAVMIKKIKVK